jgi:hypothetical protein
MGTVTRMLLDYFNAHNLESRLKKRNDFFESYTTASHKRNFQVG